MTDNLSSWWSTGLAITMSLSTGLYIWHRQKAQKSRHDLEKRHLKYVNDLPDPATSFWTKIEKIEQIKTEVIKREGRTFAFSMLGSTTIMVADAGLVQEITIRHFNNFVNRRIFPVFDNILSQSVFMASDSQWKRLRQVLTPAFSVGKLKLLKPRMDATVATLIKNVETKVEKESIHNVKSLFDAFSIDFLITTAFGVVIDSLNDPAHPIIVNGQKLITFQMGLLDFAKMGLISVAPRLSKTLGIELMSEYTSFFTKLSQNIMEQKRAEFKKTKNYAKANSFIEFMLEAEEASLSNDENKNNEKAKQSNKYISTDEMTAQCVIFLLAGFDTTSSSLTMVAYLLAQNPEVQKRLYTEVVTMIEKLAEQQETEIETKNIFTFFSYDAVNLKFPLLNAVIAETQRLYPPAIFIERTASADVQLTTNEGTVLELKAGEVVHIPVWSLHRDPAYWGEDAGEFKPERFLENSSAALKNAAYLPFGAGSRMCIAQRMATVELRLALLHLVRHFRFEVCPEKTEREVTFVNQFDINSPKAVHLRIVKRKCEN